MKKIYSLVLLGLLASVTSTTFAADVDSSDDEQRSPKAPHIIPVPENCKLAFDDERDSSDDEDRLNPNASASMIVFPGSQLLFANKEDGVLTSPTKQYKTNPFEAALATQLAASTIGDNWAKPSIGLPAPIGSDDDLDSDEGGLEEQSNPNTASRLEFQDADDKVPQLVQSQSPVEGDASSNDLEKSEVLYSLCKSDDVETELEKFLIKLFASGSAPAGWDLDGFSTDFDGLDEAEQLTLISDSYERYGLNRIETPYDATASKMDELD
jgi:hypothetical protein